MRKAIMLAVTIAFSSQLHAEVGDYNGFFTLFNFFIPFGADNPVTPADQEGAYPLLPNPDGFDDGFDPRAWGQWQAIQLHPDTGAVCGNGSPYKFFVNRAPTTSNEVIYMEGGGACWDYASCTGGSFLGARNPNGIPDNYLDTSNPATGFVSPFVFRAHPYSRTKVQNWNLVYIPYCTGDLYTGDRVVTYDNPNGPESVVWHHNGLRNVRAALAWLKDNVPQPGQALMTGCSAGGGGTIANYVHIREGLDPALAFMINDSGPIFPTPETASPETNPSVLLHTEVRDSWGLDDGPSIELEARLPGFVMTDLGTLNAALAEKFPEDRLGHTHFLADFNYTRYSYERFYPEVANAPNDDVRKLLVRNRWDIDSAHLINEIELYDNYGYYMPEFRDVNASHCSTIIDFENGDIQELSLELDDWISDVLDGTGPVLEAVELDPRADYAKPFNFIYFLISQLL